MPDQIIRERMFIDFDSITVSLSAEDHERLREDCRAISGSHLDGSNFHCLENWGLKSYNRWCSSCRSRVALNLVLSYRNDSNDKSVNGCDGVGEDES